MKTEVPHAVVVGLCAHGLTLVRALHRAGVKVVALEANRNLPGVRTRCADVRFVPDINGVSLIDDLTRLRATLESSEPPVLLLTNDRMIETIGTHAQCVAGAYRISWAISRDALLPLLRKDRIQSRCHQTGLNYPRTRLITDLDSLMSEVAVLRFPLIVKPTRPISAFKTIVADSIDALAAARGQMAQSMPVIVQEFIPGDDRTIRFCALYLNRGEVIARFEGRKLRSRPMGHTTIAVSEPNERVYELTRQFFDGLALSGPVSLELKEAPDGTQWVIEPTVGRTDFWVGLCIANNVDLPFIEYQTEVSAQGACCPQRDTHIWINGERDPGAIAWLLAHAPGTLLSRRVRGVYADADDFGPFSAALKRHVSMLPSRAARKAKKLIFSH